ncbi:hypothetical protein GJ744_012131 [Endocarpon pusillum]|uniref:Uncharacterized protein n=1 Tax=Endocarpon pusillum TaxID=364733 RepID=A0A8H7AF07_9EURO|nr:hypothetical protein GJ744_012131 [Endocarpon pusillum]
MDATPRRQQASNRTYADVLSGTGDSFATPELRAVSCDGKTCFKGTSSSIWHELDHILHVSNFPKLHDRAYRKEPIQSTELDNFWASNYGLPMPKQSFKVVDSAIRSAVNILLNALKAVPSDWPGLKAVGMAGFAAEAEKILLYNLFQNRENRDPRQKRMGIRFVEVKLSLESSSPITMCTEKCVLLQSSHSPRSFHGEVYAAISNQVVRLFAGFWRTHSLFRDETVRLYRAGDHDVTEDFMAYVMKSQEAIIFHKILHHIEEKTVMALLKQQYDASDILTFNGTCKIGDVTFDKVADTSNEQDSITLNRYSTTDINGRYHCAGAYSVKPCQALAALKRGQIGSIQNADSIVYAAASALLYQYWRLLPGRATSVVGHLRPSLAEPDLLALKIHWERSVRSFQEERVRD